MNANRPVMNDPDVPVTVFARHTVRPGREPAFRAWLAGISEACRSYDGYQGTELLRPFSGSTSEFVAVFRFDTREQLQAWMDSREHGHWLQRAREFSDSPARLDYHSLEFLFDPARRHGRFPTRHKMALVTFLVIWPLVHFIPSNLARVLGARPLLVELCAVAAIVLLMTYLLMPLVTKMLARWLFSEPRQSG